MAQGVREQDTFKPQEDLLRLLDTRLACLLVDHQRRREPLRDCLQQLRDRLSREPLDPATLAEVEATVRSLSRPAADRPADTPRPHETARRRSRLRLGHRAMRTLL